MKDYLLTIFIILILNSNIFAQRVIDMEYDNGIYKIPCKVNGIPMKFILDTGASDVSISLTEAKFLIKQGLLTEDNIVGTVKYRIANGDINEGTKIILNEIEVGGKIITNIEASIVHNLEAPLLLGQSAISKLGRIELNGNKLTLIETSSSNNSLNLLDERYGFKSIKFDTPITDFRNLIFLEKFDNELLYQYKPEDQNLYYVFDERYKYVILYFNSDTKRLSAIRLQNEESKKLYSDVSSNHLKSENVIKYFNAIIGKHHSVIDFENEMKLGVNWMGNKVKLIVYTQFTNPSLNESGLPITDISHHVLFRKK